MLEITEFCDEDIKEVLNIQNDIVKDGIVFPQAEILNEKNGLEFFKSQPFTSEAKLDGEISGLYILHPNNVEKCGHICNVSYAVSKDNRGHHIGEFLVKHCLETAKEKENIAIQCRCRHKLQCVGSL